MNDYIILWQNYLRNNVQTFITIGLLIYKIFEKFLGVFFYGAQCSCPNTNSVSRSTENIRNIKCKQ